MKRCGTCKNCNIFLTEKAAYAAARSEAPANLVDNWIASWNAKKVDLDLELPCTDSVAAEALYKEFKRSAQNGS